MAWSWLAVWGGGKQDYGKVLMLGSCASSANGQMTVTLRSVCRSLLWVNSEASQYRQGCLVSSQTLRVNFTGT